MASKSKTEGKIPVLKGKEAEVKVLEYLKRMNRPYGAVDVAANLKGAVSKSSTQKILISLAEKGFLVQKIYGKTTFFVANQAGMESLLPEKISDLDAELKAVEEDNKNLAADVRILNAGKSNLVIVRFLEISSELVRLKTVPTDQELGALLANATVTIDSLIDRLQPLRAGVPIISTEGLAQIESEWSKWRAEWDKRRKIFISFWQLATDALTPQEASVLADNLGIENDSAEHSTLELRPLFQSSKPSNPLKRKR